MTANKIYTEHIKSSKVPFNYWIETEKYLYERSDTKLPFINWLNKKYQLNGRNAWVNADGELRHKEVIETLGEYIQDNYNSGINKGAETEREKAEKEIAELKAKQRARIKNITRKTIIIGLGAVAFWYFLKKDSKKK